MSIPTCKRLYNTTIAQKISEISTDPVIKDCSDALGSISIINGKSIQTTSRTGNNILGLPDGYTVTKDGVTVSINDGVIKVNGTTTEVTEIDIPINKVALKGNYTYSLSASNVTNNSSISFTLYDSDKKTIGAYITCGKEGIQKSAQLTNINKTIEYIHFWATANLTYTNIEYYYMVSEGSFDFPFEQFVPTSPSPEYPSEIKNVGNNVQLFDLNTYFENCFTRNCSKELLDNGIRLKFTSGSDAYVNEAIGSGGTVSDTSKATCIKVKPNTTYTLKISSVPKCYISYLDENYKSSGYTKIPNNIYTFKTSTTTCYLYIRLGYKSETSGLTMYDFTDIKLQEGSAVNPYVDTGCGSIDLKVANENLINPFGKNEKESTFSRNGINGKFNEDGSLTLKGTATGNLNIVFDRVNKNYLKINENYYLKGGIDNNISLRVGYSDYTGYIYEYPYIEKGKGTSFTYQYSSNENATNLDFLIRIVSGAVVDTTIYPMLNKGSTATPYVPHEEQYINFPLTEGQLLHEGDYLAEDGIHQNRKTIIFDGTEKWKLSNTDTTDTRLSVYINFIEVYGKDDLDYTKDGLCSHFKYYNLADFTNYEEYIVFDKNALGIGMKKTDVADLNSFKSYLAQQYANGTPVMVEYELTEEIITPLTDTQQKCLYDYRHIKMYKGNTSIGCLNPVKPDIQCLYYYNNEINNNYAVRLDNLEQSDVYNNQEHIVGYWFNKPLYRKCLTIILPSEALNSDYECADLSDLNIDKLVKLEGFIEGANTQVIINMAYKGNGQYCSMYYIKSNKKLRYACNNEQYVSVPAYIILEYTKMNN